MSDTPRTDAAVYIASDYDDVVSVDFARDLERELTAATKRRDGRAEMNVIKIEANKAGTRYALVKKEDSLFAVYKECSNYAAHVLGGIARTWRYCEKGLQLDVAEQLFARKVAGRSR